MITDKIWREFEVYWKSRWAPSAPDRESVEQYLEWYERKIKDRLKRDGK